MIDWLAGALGMGLIFWTLVQWGFLASAVSLLCANLLTFPLTTHWSAWYAPHGLAALALVGLIALAGFFNLERPGHQTQSESAKALRRVRGSELGGI